MATRRKTPPRRKSPRTRTEEAPAAVEAEPTPENTEAFRLEPTTDPNKAQERTTVTARVSTDLYARLQYAVFCCNARGERSSVSSVTVDALEHYLKDVSLPTERLTLPGRG